MNDNNASPVIVTTTLGKSVITSDQQSLTILSEINMNIQAGESVAIVGASGSGKSTLLGLLAGLDSATSGSVELLGHKLEPLDEDARAQLRLGRVGFVYQAFNLMENLNALENVMLPLELDRTVTEIDQRALDALCEVGLEHRLNHKPGQLSGGEQQRVALARAFVTQPEILFADEPTGNLDRKNAENALELIMQLNKSYKTSLIMVTHDLHIAERLDTVYELEDGILRLQ